MRSLLKKFRIQASSSQTVWKYLLYAFGEIILIIIGILIAVKINEVQENKQNNQIRCAYLNELSYTLDYDIKDVEDNINGYEQWIPKIEALFLALKKQQIPELDSLYDKFGTVGNYIFFGQRSKSKIEELKYSNIDLINNRSLKNKIILYQDDKIMFLRDMEHRFNLVHEDTRQYYIKHFRGFNYGNTYPNDLEKVVADPVYFSLVYQILTKNYQLRSIYTDLLKEQKEIRALIMEEIANNCTEKEVLSE